MKSFALFGAWLVFVACAAPGAQVAGPAAPEPVGGASAEREEAAATPEAEPTAEAEPIGAPGRPDRSAPAPDRAGQDEPTSSEYRREDWPHWIDADGDCQDTRTEVLVAEAEPGSIVFTDARQCKIAAGRWRCPYTGRVITDPRQLDVDHLVPLAHAHAAGGKSWSRAQRTAFANDLGDARHLVAVVAGANRSKGARSIETWLPPNATARCEYVDAWRAITARWSLRATSREAELAEAYAADCREGRTPQLAGEADPAAPSERAEPRGACCKVCSAGTPCGDGCIAKDKVCRKPPGCAC